MLHMLAEKRCKDFGTCTDGRAGPAKANLNALRIARTGREHILNYDCAGADVQFHAIVDQMTVPLIQGMLKYAFKADPANDQGSCTGGSCDKEWAEGWAFAAAVLPRLHYCSYETADMVRANLDVANVAPMKDGFAILKAEVESLYPCLGLTCADVGAFQNRAGVYTGADACTDDKGEEDVGDGCPAPPATEAPAETTAEPTEPAVVDSMAYPFAALSGIVFLVN